MKLSIPLLGRFFSPLLFTLIVVLSGCFPGGPPTAPDPVDDELAFEDPTPVQVREPTVVGPRIALHPRSLTKPVPGSKSLYKKKRIGKKGGVIGIINKQTGAIFTVPRGALKKKTAISMELLGEGASVQVLFGPSELHFLKSCTLTLFFPLDGIDLANLGAYLIEETGATPVPYIVEVKGNIVILKIQIDHFSIYSPDDGSE
jgi:hypothetical protein